MWRFSIVVLITTLLVVACNLQPAVTVHDFSQLPVETAQDFSLILTWSTGSLPPQYTYIYVVKLGPGLQGVLEYRPGYDLHDISRQWVADFTVSEQQMNDLFEYLQSQDMFRSNWKKGEPMEGSPGTSLILDVSGNEFHVPSISILDRTELARVDAAIEAIRTLVPQTIWDELDARQKEYEANFEE